MTLETLGREISLSPPRFFAERVMIEGPTADQELVHALIVVLEGRAEVDGLRLLASAMTVLLGRMDEADAQPVIDYVRDNLATMVDVQRARYAREGTA